MAKGSQGSVPEGSTLCRGRSCKLALKRRGEKVCPVQETAGKAGKGQSCLGIQFRGGAVTKPAQDARFNRGAAE